jgi:integrase
MNAVPVFKPTETRAKVIDLSEVMRVMDKKKEVKLNKDGSVDKRHSNKVAGVSSEVYAFTSEEEVEAMVDVFNSKIDNAPDDDKRRIAARNKMLFVLGVNLGIRASDLCGLKYSFFINDDGTFKDSYSLQPKKTKKTGKYVKLYFNKTVKKVITEYLNEYPVEDLDAYLFQSRKGDGHITEISLGRIIKDAAAEVGIERNICSHSLRKTFGYFIYHNAEDKNNALIILQKIFNHSSPAITSKYIGLTDNEISDVFNTLNLGDEFI